MTTSDATRATSAMTDTQHVHESQPSTSADPTAGHAPSAPSPGIARRALANRSTTILLLLVIVFVVFAATQDGFLSGSTIRLMLLSSSVLFVTAIGLTFVLLAGGFDLSIGALLTLSGYVFAWLINSFDLPAVAAMACTVAFGIVVAGVTNGFLIGRLRLSFMVVTLGTMTLFAGLAKWVNLASQPILGDSGQADFLQYTFYQGAIIGVPIPVAVCLVVFLLAAFVLRFTLFGRDVHAVGGNSAAAQLSGISVSWTIVAVYAIAGGSAALASVISSSITSSAINTAGDTVMLQAAAAVLVGGTSLRGGSGTVTGTAIGVLFFGVLHQGLQHYNTAWEQIISGAIVAGAALADKVQRDGWASLEIRRPAVFSRPRPKATA
jgi:ribose transport system permease protein